MDVEPFEFMDIVTAQDLATDATQLLTISDGSDDSGSMTFGWVIALPSGRRLTQCSGPAFGPTGSSFCAEGYDLLSVTRFLIHLCVFCSSSPPWSIKMLTDNQGLITLVTTTLLYPDPFPNPMLASDWDVSHEISSSLRSMSKLPTLAHVKGYQDSHTPYHDLSLEAQLNVDVDAEAGSYQCTYPAQRPNNVQLHIDGKVICSKLKCTICDTTSVPQYLTYVVSRFKWSPSVAATIGWTAYTQTINRFRTQRVQIITKLCNNLLPTARWANRYQSLTTEHCIHCGKIEDRDHIIQCSHEPRNTWRKSLLSKLRKAHASDMSDHYLSNILVNALHLWFSGSVLCPLRYPKQYHQLISEQSALGWCHLFNRHLTDQWRLCQDYYMCCHKISTNTHTGAGWSLRTLTILWTKFFVLWKQRYESIHGHDLKTQNQAKQQKLGLEMEMLHSLREQVLEGDTDVFIGNNPAALSQFLETATNTHVQNWIHIWKPFILSSVKSATDLSIRGVHCLSTYFIPARAVPHRPLAARAHRKARPRIQNHPLLP
jgi:hypothetical protein